MRDRVPPWLPLLVVTLAGSAVMAATTPSFATPFNIFVILQGAAIYALLGFAVMVVLAVRDITLAVGGIGSACAIAFGYTVEQLYVPAPLAAVIAMVIGGLFGFANGLIITRARLVGFVVTLATGAALSGLALGLTRANAITGIPDAWVAFGQGRWGLVPMIAVATIVIAAVLHVVFRSTPFGRAMLTAGGNPDAARLAGISPERQVMRAHVLSGVLAAAAAVLFVGRLGSAPPDLGSSWTLISFAVPIIGGTALVGGRVSVPGALVAAVVLATIDDALILLNVSQYGVLFAQGLLILAAVLFGRLGEFGALRRRQRASTP